MLKNDAKSMEEEMVCTETLHQRESFYLENTRQNNSRKIQTSAVLEDKLEYQEIDFSDINWEIIIT